MAVKYLFEAIPLFLVAVFCFEFASTAVEADSRRCLVDQVCLGQIAAEPIKTSPVATTEPVFINPNVLVLELAPGHRDAYGPNDNPSVDLDIRFAYNSAELELISMRQLDALGEAMKSYALRKATFEIIGHTDTKGTTAYNQILSEKRAAAVRSYLLDRFRLDAELIKAFGRGENDLKDASLPESAVNRRVEVKAIFKRRPQSPSSGPANSAPRANTNGKTSGWRDDRASPDATNPNQSGDEAERKIKW